MPHGFPLEFVPIHLGGDGDAAGVSAFFFLDDDVVVVVVVVVSAGRLFVGAGVRGCARS